VSAGRAAAGKGLTPAQQCDVTRARDLAAVMPNSDALRNYLERSGITVRGEHPHPEACGVAAVRIRDLLAIIDGLTGGAK
jgi:hypothetical protein